MIHRIENAKAVEVCDVTKEVASTGRAWAGRATSLQILCDQLDHTTANLTRLESELARLIASDPGVKGLSQVQEVGLKTVAVWRAELGDVARFSRTDQAIAYGGLDIEIKESGHRIGKAKLSKRGSGLLRRVLAPFCFAEHSPRRLRFWGLLSSLGGARAEVWLGADGGDAQNAGGRGSLAQTRPGER